jgi:hypothetical protein
MTINDVIMQVRIHNELHNKAPDSKVRRTLCAFVNVFNAFLSEYIYLLVRSPMILVAFQQVTIVQKVCPTSQNFLLPFLFKFFPKNFIAYLLVE